MKFVIATVFHTLSRDALEGNTKIFFILHDARLHDGYCPVHQLSNAKILLNETVSKTVVSEDPCTILNDDLF